MKEMITQPRLKELLSYDPDTGVFTWAVNRFRARVGMVAGSLHGEGYRKIKLDGIDYLEHRLAWLYVTGAFPQEDTDHINGNRADNRIVNLRDVSRTTNMHNERAPRTNGTSGFLGVSWVSSRKKWRAKITVGSKRKTIGEFSSPEAAHEAYLNAKRVLHADGCTI